MSAAPAYHFRLRDAGSAAVFQVEEEARSGRLNLRQIAVVNLRSGDIRPRGGQPLPEGAEAAIDAWVAARRRLATARRSDDMHRLVDQLGLAAQWAQSEADEESLEQVTDALLMAMHDLRSVLVRRKAERLRGAGPKG